MRVVIQRVLEASVDIDYQVYNEIGKGYLVLFGFEEVESEDDFDYVIKKLLNLRLFGDENGKMNLGLKEVKGELLMISQFTLFASCKKGNRPSFIRSASFEKAKEYENIFYERLSKDVDFKTGIFGADMKVKLVNDGPVTICLDSKNRE